MANAGNSFVITIKQTHISWGTFRYTHTREPIYGETYIPIPIYYAEEFNIYPELFIQP